MACSVSQLRLATGLLVLVDKQLFPQTCKHWRNKFWQLAEQPLWAILFFAMGVKLPARLIAIEEKKIIAVAVIFIWMLP